MLVSMLYCRMIPFIFNSPRIAKVEFRGMSQQGFKDTSCIITAAKHTVNPVYDGPEGPAEDYISGLVGLEGGKTLQIDCSRWSHADTPTRVEVYGRDGAIAHGKISRFVEGEYVVEEANVPSDVAHSEPPRACSKISPAVRLPMKPIVPVAQKVHPILHPT